jgi:hypothetical protein
MKTVVKFLIFYLKPYNYNTPENGRIIGNCKTSMVSSSKRVDLAREESKVMVL